MLRTDLLIVGAGPAGASLACFLGSHGFKGLLISAAPGTADTPRAHIFNPAALECLRDIGLDEECLRLAVDGDFMRHTRFCHSLAGDEFGRIYSWGNDPKRADDYDAASPCRHVDLPQTELEPILVRYAAHHGFPARFESAYLSHTVEPDGSIICSVQDKLNGTEYQVHAKYLFGADGGRSKIVRDLEIPMIEKPGQGLAINVLFEADLSHLVKNRVGNLHWVLQPDRERPDYGWAGLIRMVSPWRKWIAILFPKPGSDFKFTPSPEDYKDCVQQFVGDDTELKITGVSKWYINETVASKYSSGNIFCLGDAVHRHPPFNGLGSNTCIQDAFNLAWKIAFVEKGWAARSLLDTYSPERQPVGESVVTRANQGLRDHLLVWESLGMFDGVEGGAAALKELGEATEAGRARRAKLRRGIQGTEHEFHAIGQEMNQRYLSKAVYLEDEVARPPLPENPVLHHEITTYPGSRLPHAWLNTTSPGKQFSTIDLAGKGSFSLFTGIGGADWRAAAKTVAGELGLSINVFSIGWKQDYEDVYGDWQTRSEISEDGCVLVRPDRFVAWRSKTMINDPKEKLSKVMKNILGRE